MGVLVYFVAIVMSVEGNNGKPRNLETDKSGIEPGLTRHQCYQSVLKKERKCDVIYN